MPRDIATRTVERDGIRYRVDIDPDTDTTPSDFDCYGPHDVAAFHTEAWCYVTVTVTLNCDHLDISERVTGVEYGSLDDIDITIDHLIDDHPVTEMIRACEATFNRLRQQLNQPAATPDTVTLTLIGGRGPHHAQRAGDRPTALGRRRYHRRDRRRTTRAPAIGRRTGHGHHRAHPRGYAGIAVIAHTEGDTYRRLAVRLRPLIDAADSQ
jgi:hypothetical protein